MSTQVPESKSVSWVDNEEPLDDYAHSGLHPATIGEVLGERYKILSKLGWGVYSTVWLVEDTTNGKYAALKLLSAFITETPQLHELEYLQRIRRQDPDHPGYKHVVQLLDHFHHEGPNGKHICLVTELLAESMTSFTRYWENDRLPIPVVKRITRQIISGLDYLHNTCNIIHTDIKPSNILFRMKDIELSGLISEPSETRTETGPNDLSVSRTRSRPIAVSPPPNFNSADAWEGAEAQLIDVGVSCWADKVDEHFTDLIQSPALRAPEVVVGAGWGKTADIWSLGLTVYQMVMGQSFIHADIRDDSVPYMHSIYFGLYPDNILKRGKYADRFFKPDGTLKFSLGDRIPLDDLVKKRGAPLDREGFVDFLNLMLKLDPEERASYQELLTHKWLAVD